MCMITNCNARGLSMHVYRPRGEGMDTLVMPSCRARVCDINRPVLPKHIHINGFVITLDACLFGVINLSMIARDRHMGKVSGYIANASSPLVHKAMGYVMYVPCPFNLRHRGLLTDALSI